MKQVSIREAKDTLPALVRAVEQGERVVITRNGKAVADVVPHERRGGIDWVALRAWKTPPDGRVVTFIDGGFDDPLEEDFLIAPER